MFNNKKGQIMRHPYATLAIIGLATAGAIGLTNKVKNIFSCKKNSVSCKIKGIKENSEQMN